jgi:fatty acid desaturase
MVPYHALPKLHEEIKHDCPTPSPNFRSALKEVITALIKQKDDPAYVVIRDLPSTARPYMHGISASAELKSS